MNKPHQRVGAKSNAHVGSAFEAKALKYFAKQGIMLQKNFPVDVGVHKTKTRLRKFDMGSANPRILVECKSHTWTAGDRVPVAKFTAWTEAMFYFHIAPPSYRKILFVKHHRRSRNNESLLAYYRSHFGHLIPKGVEFLEFNEKTGRVVCLTP
jgi:hypothetical protein